MSHYILSVTNKKSFFVLQAVKQQSTTTKNNIFRALEYSDSTYSAIYQKMRKTQSKYIFGLENVNNKAVLREMAKM